MNKRPWMRWLVSSSDNRKSKTCPELCRRIENLRGILPTIENPKSKIQNVVVGVFALAVAFALCGPGADAQQTGKVLRIGVLDPSTASGSAVLWRRSGRS